MTIARLDDPVMESLRLVLTAFYQPMDLLKQQIASFHRADLSLEDNTWLRGGASQLLSLKFGKLVDFEAECDDREGSKDLDFAFANFSRFENAVDELFAAIKKVFTDFWPEQVDTLIKEQLTAPRNEFLRLKALVKLVTPGHLALQGHLRKLTLAWPSASWDETHRRFAPLYDLRDSFFLSPSLGVISQYLELSQKFTYEAYYKEMPNADWIADSYVVELEGYALTLEVLSLMDGVVSA